MALQAQGRPLKVRLPGREVGIDENGNFTTNSFMYRGKPFSLLNAIDRAAMDYFNEVAKVSVQRGQRVVALYMRTGKTLPS